jgi:hypothetical protein
MAKAAFNKALSCLTIALLLRGKDFSGSNRCGLTGLLT